MGHQRERIPEAPHQAKRRSLRIVYFNARSIVNKINEVRLYILDTDPDVIAIEAIGESIEDQTRGLIFSNMRAHCADPGL